MDASAISLFVNRQAELEPLRGCRELAVNLHVNVPEAEAEAFTLEPLAELEVVRGLLSIAGPLRSLAGLEALRQVVGLTLSRLSVPDLTPLRGLTTVIREPDDARLAGGIRIEDRDQLTERRGPENARVWSTLALGGLDNLTTLDGLHVPPPAESVAASYVPLLSDASALAALEQLGSPSLVGTAVRDLAGYQLEVAESISLSLEPGAHRSGRPHRAPGVGFSTIEDNDAPVRIELPALDDFDGITILGNAALSSPAARARRRAGGRQPPDALGRRLRGRADLHARAGRQPRRALTPVRAHRSPLPPHPTHV